MNAGVHRAGLTLVEVLVASVLLMIFGAAVTSAFSVAAQLHRVAGMVAERSGAFEPFVVAAGASLSSLPSCPTADAATVAGGTASPTVCRVETLACGVDGSEVRCDGGDLRRVRLGWTGSVPQGTGSAGSRDTTATIDVWFRERP